MVCKIFRTCEICGKDSEVVYVLDHKVGTDLVGKYMCHSCFEAFRKGK